MNAHPSQQSRSAKYPTPGDGPPRGTRSQTLLGIAGSITIILTIMGVSHLGRGDKHSKASPGPLPQPSSAAAGAASDEGQAEKDGATLDERSEILLALAKDPEVVTRGETLFRQLCAACHGGPGDAARFGDGAENVFDGAWVHSDRPSGVETVIIEGIDGTNMLPWGSFPKEDIEAMTAYLLAHQAD